MEQTDIREQVRERYAKAASGDGCCDTDCCGDSSLSTDITGGLYTQTELASIPGSAAEVSLGCGNPTAVAELAEGEKVLDLGSGGGIDVLLAAQRVGPGGFVYGLDMTDEMLELARENARQAGAVNVEFVRGFIEEIPLEDDHTRCRNLQLRHQSVRGQAVRVQGDPPCSSTRRTDRHKRHRRR